MRLPKLPLDNFPYGRDPRSTTISVLLPDGNYVYVQDVDGSIWVLPDGGHLHPKVLGNAASALYAGDLRIHYRRIVDVTNLSGTFQFDDCEGLLAVIPSDDLNWIDTEWFRAARNAIVDFAPFCGARPAQPVQPVVPRETM